MKQTKSTEQLLPANAKPNDNEAKENAKKSANNKKGTSLSPISRMPISFGRNHSLWESTFSYRAGIARDIVVFISKNLKQNLFNSFTFDLSQFARTMGYSEDFLRRYYNAPDENGKRNERKKWKAPKLNDHVFDSNFDYALFDMLRTALVVEGEKTKENSISFHAIRLLNDITIHTDPKVNNKRIYEVRLANEFVMAVLKEYQNINFNDYIKISSGNNQNKAGMRSLYLKLAYMQQVAYSAFKNPLTANKHPQPTYTTTVNVLCDVADIEISQTPDNKKRQLIKTLKLAQNNIMKKNNENSEPGDLFFEYEFFAMPNKNGKIDNRVKYGVKIIFPIDKNKMYEGKDETLFWNLLVQYLKNIFCKKYPDDWENINNTDDYNIYKYNNKFSKWLSNRQTDYEDKLEEVCIAIKNSFYKSRSMDEELRTTILNEAVQYFNGYSIELE